jgi:hypothetical protein
VHQGTPSQTSHLREFSEVLRYNSPDMFSAHRTVSSAPEESVSELASFGFPLRYNSPDCPVSQRSNGYFVPTVVCNALNARQRAQRSRARAGGTPDSQAGPHVRAPTVGTQRLGDMAGASNSVRWRTGLSGAPCDSSLHQTASLVVGVINTPNHPTFKSSRLSNFQPLTRALAFNSRHTQVIKSSPNSTKALVLSESDLLCSFELLRLNCFLLSFFLAIISFVSKARDTNCVVVLAGSLIPN